MLSSLLDDCLERVTYVPDTVSPLELGGRVTAYLFFSIWGIRFLLSPMASPTIMESFMHLVNLPFHEAGHVLFGIFGWSFLMSLGGSLAQILFPLLVGGALLVKNRDPFGASLGLWWTGQSFMDLAPYIGDARALQLVLIGGKTGAEVEGHDWEAILTALGWLRYDTTLARLSHVTGWLLIATAIAWGGYILFQQSRRLET